MLGVLLLGQKLHKALQNIHASPGAEEVCPGQVGWQAVGKGGVRQQTDHQLRQTRYGHERGSHLRGHQPHAMSELEDAGPNRPDHIRVQGIVLQQLIAEALLGVLPHSLLLQQALHRRPRLGGGRALQGLKKVGQEVFHCRCLANAAEVVLQLLEEATVLWLVRATSLLPGELSYLLLHLLHTDPQVPITANQILTINR